jgi:hypothetical protein
MAQANLQYEFDRHKCKRDDVIITCQTYLPSLFRDDPR